VGAAPDRAKRTPRRTSAVLGWAKKVIGEVGGVGDWVREGGDWGLRATPSRKSSQKPVDEGVHLGGQRRCCRCGTAAQKVVTRLAARTQNSPLKLITH
jgi:hypothetical protein